MRFPFRKVFATIGATLLLFVFTIGPGWSLAKEVGGPRMAGVEFPLSNPRDVAVDSKGRIYIAECRFGRVQRYSPEGKFQLGWSVPTAGMFALMTTEGDRIRVATARANKLLTYSADGALLDGGSYYHHTDHTDFYLEFENEQITPGDYVIRRGPLRVDTRDGRTVIATSLHRC